VARQKKPSPNDLVFIIDGLTPETLPLDRAAKYLEAFAEMVGNDNGVHLVAIEKGSCQLKAFVEDKALSRIRDRVRSITDGTAPKASLKARMDADEMLAVDNTSGRIQLGGEDLIEFIGLSKNSQIEYGPITRPSSITGKIWSIGGKDETVNVYLRDDDRQDHRCVVSVAMAKRLTPYLFGRKVRLSGIGQWNRVDGLWQLKSLTADEVTELDDSSLSDSIARMRGLFEGVDTQEFLDTMDNLRHG
jgi:hypothetical protein